MPEVTGGRGAGWSRAQRWSGPLTTAVLCILLAVFSLADGGWPAQTVALTAGLPAAVLVVAGTHLIVTRRGPTAARTSDSGLCLAAGAAVLVGVATVLAVAELAPRHALEWALVPGMAGSAWLGARGWRRRDLVLGVVVVLMLAVAAAAAGLPPEHPLAGQLLLTAAVLVMPVALDALQVWLWRLGGRSGSPRGRRAGPGTSGVVSRTPRRTG